MKKKRIAAIAISMAVAAGLVAPLQQEQQEVLRQEPAQTETAIP